MSETRRMTSALQAGFRIKAGNSQPRLIKVLALSGKSRVLLKIVAERRWNCVAFYTVEPSSRLLDEDGSIAYDVFDLAGRAVIIEEEIAQANIFVVVVHPEDDLRGIRKIIELCELSQKPLMGVILAQKSADENKIVAALHSLRPYTRMLTIASEVGYLEAMLEALGA